MLFSYVDMAMTSCVLLYWVKKKENLRWVFLCMEVGEYIMGEFVFIFVDVLIMVSKNVKIKKIKCEVDKVLVEVSAEELYLNCVKDDEL